MSVEVAITSDASGQLWNCCVWNLETGSSLMTYKGGTSGAKTLNLIKQDYLISSLANKKILNIWSLNRREQLQQKMICPGIVTALAVSPDGNYCAVAVEEKLHIWQISSGCLLAVLGHHYQPITCVRFTNDGTSFISAGKDCLALVWNMFDVLNADDMLTSAEPRHSWSQHGLPITDVCIGTGSALKARVATVSLDQTCKVFDLRSGELLLSIMFDFPLTSVTMDYCEFHLFIGSNSGKIFRFNLYDPPRTVEHHYQENSNKIYEGHSKKVTVLSISMDGNTLLSGSDDCSVRLWDVQSFTCIQVLPHKGAITNAFIVMTPNDMFSAKTNSSKTPLVPFKRHLHNPNDGNDDEIHLRLCDSQVDSRLTRHEHNNYIPEIGEEKTLEEENSRMAEEITSLREVSRKIYISAIDYALKHPSVPDNSFE